MSSAYINMLIESQEKKLELLDRVIELDKEQETIVTGDKPDMEALNANLTAKGALVDELNKLDEGFDSVYAKVREELINNKEAHKSEIGRLQELIRQIMDKTADIEAMEARSKINVETFLKRRKKELREGRNSIQAASVYSTNMRRAYDTSPFFVDNKK
jgi:predicted outer membrane protein